MMKIENVGKQDLRSKLNAAAPVTLRYREWVNNKTGSLDFHNYSSKDIVCSFASNQSLSPITMNTRLSKYVSLEI